MFRRFVLAALGAMGCNAIYGLEETTTSDRLREGCPPIGTTPAYSATLTQSL